MMKNFPFVAATTTHQQLKHIMPKADINMQRQCQLLAHILVFTTIRQDYSNLCQLNNHKFFILNTITYFINQIS